MRQIDVDVIWRKQNHVLENRAKDICEETLRKDIDNDTVLLCLGVAEQFSVSRLKVRTIDVPYCSYKLRSWSKVWFKKSLSFFFRLCSRWLGQSAPPKKWGGVKLCQTGPSYPPSAQLRSQCFSLKFRRGAKALGPSLSLSSSHLYRVS